MKSLITVLVLFVSTQALALKSMSEFDAIGFSRAGVRAFVENLECNLDDIGSFEIEENLNSSTPSVSVYSLAQTSGRDCKLNPLTQCITQYKFVNQQWKTKNTICDTRN